MAARRYRWIDTLSVVFAIGVLLALLLPAMNVARSGPASICKQNTKDIVLAMMQFETFRGHLPMQMGGTYDSQSDSGGWEPPGNNRRRLSALVEILPWLDQQALFERIVEGTGGDGENAVGGYAPWGPAPWTRQYPP